MRIRNIFKVDALNALSLQQQLIIAVSFAFVATFGSALVAMLSGLPIQLAFWEVAAVFTSYICVILFITQTRVSYVFGIISTFCYFIFLWAELRALALFNLYLVGSLIFGYIRWGKDTNSRPIERIKVGGWLVGYIVLGVAIYIILNIINAVWLDGSISNLEIWATLLSGVAQLMLDNKVLDNWFVWIVVNILSIGLYFQQGYVLTGFQYIFFLFTAVIGLFVWYNKYVEQERIAAI